MEREHVCFPYCAKLSVSCKYFFRAKCMNWHITPPSQKSSHQFFTFHKHFFALVSCTGGALPHHTVRKNIWEFKEIYCSHHFPSLFSIRPHTFYFPPLFNSEQLCCVLLFWRTLHEMFNVNWFWTKNWKKIKCHPVVMIKETGGKKRWDYLQASYAINCAGCQQPYIDFATAWKAQLLRKQAWRMFSGIFPQKRDWSTSDSTDS